MPTRSYAIIGTGALGGFYGGKLAHANHNVRFLLRSDYDHVKQHGMIIDSVDGDFILPKVNAYNDVHDMPRCDVVCVCLKTTANDALPDLLPHVIKNNGVVIVMQNGLNIENYVADIVSPNRVMGALCFLCSNKIAPGHINHLDFGQIVLAEYRDDGLPAGITQPMRDIAMDFKSSGIDITLVDDLILARWQKLVWNIPFNGLSVVLNTTTDQIMNNPDSCELAEKIMWEVVAVAEACGRKISSEFVEQRLENTRKMKPYKPSMLLDYQNGKSLELKAIYQTPLDLADKAGIEMPRTQALYQQLRSLDAHNHRH